MNNFGVIIIIILYFSLLNRFNKENINVFGINSQTLLKCLPQVFIQIMKITTFAKLLLVIQCCLSIYRVKQKETSLYYGVTDICPLRPCVETYQNICNLKERDETSFNAL